jgi:hypothetical protein
MYPKQAATSRKQPLCNLISGNNLQKNNPKNNLCGVSFYYTYISSLFRMMFAKAKHE